MTQVSGSSPDSRRYVKAGYEVYVKADGDQIRMTVTDARRNAYSALPYGHLKKISQQLFDAIAGDVGGVPRAPWPQSDLG